MGKRLPTAAEALDRLIAGNARFVRHDEQLQRGVEANVRWSLEQIRVTPEAQAKAATGQFKLVGAVYEIASGMVRFLP